MGSLDGADPVRLAFVAQMIQLMRDIDPLDRLVSASVAHPKRTDEELYNLQGIDAAGFVWQCGEVPEEDFGETVEGLRQFGKPVVNHCTRPPRSGNADIAEERNRLVEAARLNAFSFVRPESVYPHTQDWLNELIQSICP
jgi:hypothetical protein